jgi:hypothetical protein
MATRAETFRAGAQRTGKGKKTSVKKPKKAAWGHDKGHAGRKATRALEASARRPSRESTRASANRVKSDAPFNITEETRKGAPEARARRAVAQARRVRAH